MLCRKPFMKDGAAFPCGQCSPCRFNRRRLWAHRIMLESFCHRDNCFLTLSYQDCHLPLITGGTGQDLMRPELGSLKPKDLQDWLKRLRKAIEPLRVRFYAVGEYGSNTWRPHYHVILFGFPTCMRGRTLRRVGSTRAVWEECCDNCKLIGETWGLGDVDLGTLTRDSAAYCAEYTVKKMTSVDDTRLIRGNLTLVPEFCRMSLRPGIGVDAMWDVASEMMRYNLDMRPDVPSALAHGRSERPLGRYLRGKLREMVGKEKGAPDETLEAIKAELLPLREAAFNSSTSFKDAVVRAGDGRVAQIEALSLIHKRRNVL